MTPTHDHDPRRPGKFEGEPTYVPYYWDIDADDEWFDESDACIRVYIVTADDHALFSDLLTGQILVLWADNNGFVNARVFHTDDAYQAVRATCEGGMVTRAHATALRRQRARDHHPRTSYPVVTLDVAGVGDYVQIIDVTATSLGEALTMIERADAGVRDRLYGILPEDYETARAEGIAFNEADGLLVDPRDPLKR